MGAIDIVNKAREKGRATSQDYINNIFTDFIELHGDRSFSDDKAIIAGIGRLNGMPVTIIGIEKGQSTDEKIMRNFGSVNPEGYKKALRHMKLAEKFKRPIVCFVDTSGAYCGIGAEERGQGYAIAQNLMEMMTLNTPILSILIGEGGSGGALALSVSDEVWMMENSIYSVISPEGCASILWKDTKKVAEAADCLKITANNLLKFDVVEKIIKEPGDFSKVYENLKKEIANFIDCYMKNENLTQSRYDRFRKFGR